MSEIKNFTLRIDDDMLKKFHSVCRYDGRSANSQLLIYIRNSIERFEQKHGVIDLEATEKKPR